MASLRDLSQPETNIPEEIEITYSYLRSDTESGAVLSCEFQGFLDM